MPEFWEKAFRENAKMWGEQPNDNAYQALEIFQKHQVRNILIPGFGYGRNAKVFFEAGISLTGIEISKTAIKRARKQFGEETTIFCGSVNEMPFDNLQYDGLYCYSLIHLLDEGDRKKLIENCFKQIKPGGILIFLALSTKDQRFEKGTILEKNGYLSPHGLYLYFYNKKAIEKEFGGFGLVESKEINEPEKNPKEKLWMILCKK